jgi:hypothetical protein
MVIEASDPTGLDSNIGATGSDGLSFGYYSSTSVSENVAATMTNVTIVIAFVAVGGETVFVVQAVAGGATVASATGPSFIAAAADFINNVGSKFIPDMNSKGHLISAFGKEGAEIIAEIGNEMAKEAGAKGFSYQEKEDGTVDITVTDAKGNKTTKNVNIQEEKKKKEEEKKKNEEEQKKKAEEQASSEEDTETSSEDNETNDSRGVDPDSGPDMFQRYVQNKMLQKLLKNGDNSDNGQPIIVVETGDYGKGKMRIIVRNPYYRNVDPMKRIMKGGDPNSRTLIFNPFSPPNSIEYKNTYDKITKGRRLVMPEVDPYFW